MACASQPLVSDIWSRRRALGGLAAASALGGCVRTGSDGGCPADPADSGGITWIPDVAHPVFYGSQRVGPADGAPRNMQIYYPGARFQAPPLLKLCIGRWPIVLFLHGMPPTSGYRRPWADAWWRIPSTIARAGYVVAVPEHNAQLVEGDPALALQNAAADIQWLKTGWSGAPWLDKRPSSTVIAGHSYGALLAARFAAANPVGALISLAGPFVMDGESYAALKTVTVPSFLMWQEGGTGWDDLDALHVWEQGLSQDRYGVVFEGEHFDFVEPSDSGSAPRGACDQIGAVTADLAALFVASNIASLTPVHPGLYKPHPLTPLTPEQHVYADSYLNAFDLFKAPCHMTMRWHVGGNSGAREFGTAP